MSRLILIIICFFLVLLIGFFLIWPKYQELKNLEAKIEGKKTELQYSEEYFSKLNQLSEKLKGYEDQLAKIDFALPSDASLTSLSLINFLQGASDLNGLVFKEFSSYSITSPETAAKTPGSPETELPSKIKEIRLSFEVSGLYSALKNFLIALEKSARIIEVESISFSFEEGEIFSFALELKTHSY